MGQVRLGLCHDLGLVSVLIAVLGLVYGFQLWVLDICPFDGFDFGLDLGLSLDHNCGSLFFVQFGPSCSLVKYNKEEVAGQVMVLVLFLSIGLGLSICHGLILA